MARTHELTAREDHYRQAATGAYETGDKLGMQPPVEGRTSSHEKTRIVINVRENSSFSEVVGVLENTLVAEEGLELLVRFRGKTYVLTKAGDQLGIFSEKARS